MFISKIEKMIERLKQPATIWKLILFVFGLGVCYASLNFRIEALEEFQKEVDIMEIQKSIISIQKDVERIKINMPTKYSN